MNTQRSYARTIVLFKVTITTARATPWALLGTTLQALIDPTKVAGMSIRPASDATLAGIADNPTGAPAHGHTVDGGIWRSVPCATALTAFDLSAPGDVVAEGEVYLI